jgi:type 1 glutamine amidotransferase
MVTGASDVRYHDWKVIVPALKKVIDDSGKFRTALVETSSSLTAERLSSCNTLYVFYTGPRWGETAEKAVEQFVGNGGGMVTLHGVTYGPLMGIALNASEKFEYTPDRGWPAWRAMLGAEWKPEDLGHGKRGPFTVRVTDRSHPITSALPATFPMDDELYHKLTLYPSAKVLALAFSEKSTGGTGKDEPMMWTVNYGKGRTFHSPLGHDLRSMSEPAFQKMFLRALEWTATGKVAE